MFRPPVTDLVGQSRLLRWIDLVSAWLAQTWKSMFAYQILIEATRTDAVQDLIERTFTDYRRS